LPQIYRMIQNFGWRNFWRNSSQQRLANNILVNAQNRVDITKHSLVTHEISLSSQYYVQYIMVPSVEQVLTVEAMVRAITNISELVLNFVWAPRVLFVRRRVQIGSGRGCLPLSGLKLQIFQHHHPCHSHIHVPHIF